MPPTPTSMPSPHPSLPGSSQATSSSARFLSDLPHPRNRALRPGSNKEDMVRNYASGKLMQVSRRYVKKFGTPEPGEEISGYQNFSELCKDLDAVINVLWLSGTRKFLSPFPPAPGPKMSPLFLYEH